MKDKLVRSIPEILMAIVIICAVSFLGYLSQIIYLADSEIWSMASAKFTWEPDPNGGGAFYKPIFSALLALNYLYGETSFEMFLMGRWFFFGIGVLVLIAQFWAALLLLQSRKWALFSVLITASSYLFLSRGFRVRSDMLATFFLLLFLICGLLISKLGRLSWQWLLLALVPFWLAIFSTPKALLAGSVILVFLLWLNAEKGKVFLKEISAKKLFTIFGGTTLLSIVAVVFVSWLSKRNIEDFFYEPFKYFIGTFFGSESGTPGYMTPKSFRFFKAALEHNLLFFASLYGSWFFLAIPSLREKYLKSHRGRGWLVVGFSLSVIFFFLPDKLPFFLASLIPFLSLSVAYFLSVIFQKIESVNIRYWAIILFSVSIFVPLGFSTYRLVKEDNNRAQREAWEDLADYFSEYKGATVYTGTGLFVKENEILTFLGHGEQRYLDKKVGEFREAQPTFVVKTRKMDFIGRRLKEEFERSYILIDPGLYIRAVRINRKFNGYLELKGEDPEFAVVWPSVKKGINFWVERTFEDFHSDLVKSFSEDILGSSEFVRIYKKTLDKGFNIRKVKIERAGSVEEFVGIVKLADLDSSEIKIGFWEDAEETWMTPIMMPPREIQDYPSFDKLFAFDARY